jgi:predicted transcriptional regulator YdeE
MKPNFQTMTIDELKAYVFQHRNDTEAISAIVEKIKADPNTKWYAPEDADRFPEIYAEQMRLRDERSGS